MSGGGQYMRRSFATNGFYHLFNRGVDKREIFIDKNDYIRFIHDLYEFNDSQPAPEFSRRDQYVGRRVSHIERTTREPRDLLVNLGVFVLMPNHHHVLVEQLQEGGILIAPVGNIFLQKMIKLKKQDGKIKKENHGDFVFVPLREEDV